MFIIDLDRMEAGGELASIEIKDLSKQLVNEISPALIIAGITIKHD